MRYAKLLTIGARALIGPLINSDSYTIQLIDKSFSNKPMTNEHPLRLIVDGEPIAFSVGDTVLVAMLRTERHPTGGGCLCLAGDCPHCLATVDGVAYVRTCQVAARPGMIVNCDHAAGAYPPLPLDLQPGPAVTARNLHCDVVVIGMGNAGQAAATAAQRAGQHVITLDAQPSATGGQEVIGIYPGPLVVARTDAGMLHLYPRHEIVVATGAAELQPVAPGNELAGIVTARAATQLAAAGVDLGHIVAVGSAPTDVASEQVTGAIVRFEGSSHVEAVVVQDAQGNERRIVCDTVAVGLGLSPRDALVRMGNGLTGITIRAVGDVTLPATIPACPKAGTLCACSGVQVEDLQFIWERGFHELELVKRATLAGTGTCQGAVCLPYIRSFLADKNEILQAPFTARPVTRQLTMGEVSAGSHHHATPRTALDGEHRRLGAKLERVGGWWRPWHYGNGLAEYWAVRAAVSLGDVSTLGKLQISGPDALALLERLYPTKVATIKPGRARYVLLLDDRGYVLDDGLICRDSDTRFTLTFTSGGSTTAELWVRDWAEAWGLDVHILNQTMALGAINVTGPLAHELLARAGLHNPPPYMGHITTTVAGIQCRVFRLSFTGELSYELHHPAADSATLWRRLMVLGADLGIKPHGIETLLRLRLEKGHIIVGQDTDFDSTPRRIQHEWAVRMDKPDFVGKQAILRTNKLPIDRRLVGFEMAGLAPLEGSVIYNGTTYAGYVTSSFASPILGKTVMLGWLRTFNGELPTAVTIDSRPARRVDPPFYDPESTRARIESGPTTGESATTPALAHVLTIVAPAEASLPRILGTRIVATPAALDRAAWPATALVLRLAADEIFVSAPVAAELIDDPHAIVVPDGGFAGLWLPTAAALDFLERACEWEVPSSRPAFAQGMVAGLPMKLWLETDHVLLIVPAPYATDLQERLA